MKFTRRLPDGRWPACWNGETRYIVPAWCDALAAAGLTPGGNWQIAAPGEPVSVSEITNCYRVPLGDGKSIYFKRYVYPPATRGRYFLRASRAAREVYGYRVLGRIGIASLDVVAFGECRRLGALQAAYVVTRGVARSMDLAHYALDCWHGLPAARRAAVYRQIRARLFGQLHRAHAAGFFHQDLHWRNILVTEPEGAFGTVWIDCPRAGYRRLNRRHAEMVDLSCLARLALSYLSASERLRALRVFMGPDTSRARLHRMFRAIEAHHRRSRHPPRRIDLPRPAR